ncbi:LLM class flavin-dependent oxidoreductase [Roseiarcaceae bacterium H3SJ34-1]|uniref:LLM class flavin-dependent oxidoreductase n=1 Tax=Terripilifer ovatus TaxID=3032367 RepID=UPI003AB9816E|nr:LLM class flavin-dependent oxidoreductase [Roseiarcaceae bacterium H3SJ34-1]
MSPQPNDDSKHNLLKLGVFGLNVDNACAITTIDGVFHPTWQNVRTLTQLADDAGFEAIVPVARWRGFGGVTNFNGACFETYTWAAGVSGMTSRASVFSTSHVPTIHPVVAAKQATTIDHISGGRFALNIVCGWFEPELEMFGGQVMPHDERYAYATEWLEILKALWTEKTEFDYKGRYFQIKRGFHEPKPLQKPIPRLMNAGGSGIGRHFAAKHCDMIFVHIKGQDIDAARRDVEEVRELAQAKYNRDIEVWANCYCVIGDDDRSAHDFVDWYVTQHGDWEAVDNVVRSLGIQTGVLPPEQLESAKYHFIAGWGGFPLVGSPNHIAEKLASLSQCGLDGVLLSWPRYEQGLRRFIRDVLPLAEDAGLRTRVSEISG